MPGLLSLCLLAAFTATVAVAGATHPGAAAGDPTLVPRSALVAGTGKPSAEADRRRCIASVTALLRTDLGDMSAGRSAPGASAEQVIERTYPADSPLLRRIQVAHDALLGTAAEDLFGRYARNVHAEVAAYGSRIAAGCG